MMLGLQETFRHIYLNKVWGDDETVSGSGSRVEEARGLIMILPQLLEVLEAHSILDIPCGDFNWMQYVDLNGLKYHGGDIVPEMVAHNQERFGSSEVSFSHLDLTHDTLPPADIVMVRNCFTHLSFIQIQRCLNNLKNHDSQYLLMTTYTDLPSNQDIHSGLWRPLNLCEAPFNLPPPLKLIPEYAPGCSLGLWPTKDFKTDNLWPLRSKR